MGHKIYLNEDSSYMFYRLKNLVELDFNKFDTSKVENMESTFAYTEKMETINLKDSDLSNVENMKFTFYNAGLTEIDLS
jgi:surface protein